MSEEKKEIEILWTVPQVARYLCLNPVTVYRWVSTGKMIDPAKIVRFSNQVRVPRSEVVRIAGKTKAKLEGQA